jgi:hypothetical protein
MDKYPKEVEAFLGEVRAADQPGPNDRARIHRAFAEKLARHGLQVPAAPIPEGAGQLPPAAPAPSGALLGTRVIWALLGATALAGALIHVGTSGRQRPARPAPAPIAAAAPGAAPQRTQPLPSTASVPALASAPVAAPAQAPAIAVAPSQPHADRGSGTWQRAAAPDAASHAGHGLAEEIALIAAARTALHDDRPDAALAQLASHARRFANGALRDERDGLRVLALCQQGRVAVAAAARERFLRRAPSSLLAAQVRAACVAGSDTAPALRGGAAARREP